MHCDEHRSPFGLGMLGVLVAALTGACQAPVAATTTVATQSGGEQTTRLSRASVRALAAARAVTITAYFSPGMPSPFDATEGLVRGLLTDLQAAAPDVLVRFVDGDTEDERREAERLGVALVEHEAHGQTGEGVSGYRGIVVERGGEHRTIPVVYLDMRGVEYELIAAIRALTEPPIPVGILTGHGGPTLEDGLTTLARMTPGYELREVSAAEDLPSDLRALLVIEPRAPLSEEELRNIDELVMHGASLGVLGGGLTVDVEAQPLVGRLSNSGVNRLLERWGARIEANFVLDGECGRVPLRDPSGVAYPVLYPPAPSVTVSDALGDHPVLFRLGELPLFFVSQITTTEGFAEAGGTVLLSSSGRLPGSWLLTGDPVSVAIREPREWVTTMGEAGGPFALAVALEAQLPSAFADGGAPRRSERPVRVLVVGTSSILRDAFLPTTAPAAELRGAMAFPLRAIDWLAQDRELVAIRTSPWPDR